MSISRAVRSGSKSAFAVLLSSMFALFLMAGTVRAQTTPTMKFSEDNPTAGTTVTLTYERNGREGEISLSVSMGSGDPVTVVIGANSSTVDIAIPSNVQTVTVEDPQGDAPDLIVTTMPPGVFVPPAIFGGGQTVGWELALSRS